MPRSEPYGSFSGAFSGTIHFDWAPEPIVVANDLRATATALDNMTMPLMASRQIAAQDVEQHFATETSPDGEAWAPWAPSYAARAHGPSILTLTGAMRDAATSPAAFDVDAHPGGGEVIFTGAGLPEYWIYHQMGATRQSITGEARQFIEEFSGSVVDNILPARPFVGLSEEAEIAIIDVFDEWLGGVVGFFVSGGGVVQRRGAGGRFGTVVGLP